MKPWKNCREMKIFLSCGLIVSVIFAFVEINGAIAKDFFVAASNGKDENPGTLGAPFLTLGKGVSILSPGDTLLVRSGTYLGSSLLSSIPSGNSWVAPVTVKAYQEEKVVIVPEPGLTVLQFNPRSQYIIFEGFIFNGKGGHAGIRSGEGSHHIRIINSEIMNAPSQGILTNKGSASFEFINLRVHDNGTTDFDHGFYITSSNHVVKNCEIYRNKGRGVQLYSSTGQNSNNNLVSNNRIYDNAQSSRGAGIIIDGSGNKAINNVLMGSPDSGIIVARASNTKVYNNTVYGYGKTGIIIGNNSTNTSVINNIIFNNKTDLILAGADTIASNNLTINPKFSDEVNKDFHLQPDSAAIKAGLTLPEVTIDFEGKLRPKDSFDIGAFQSGYLQAPPTALRVLSY